MIQYFARYPKGINPKLRYRRSFMGSACNTTHLKLRRRIRFNAFVIINDPNPCRRAEGIVLTQ